MFIRLCTKHGFVITLKRIKVLDFIISGYLLYTKIFRMVIFGLVFLVYFLKLSVRNVHSIYADFDQSPSLEVRANFLDISKAFDKVWHEGLLYKLETVGISGNLPTLFQSFLSDRFQRVVLNCQSSNWSPVLAGVPQGSILGPLLFLVYINDLPDNLESSAKLFADDKSLFSTIYNPLLSAEIMNKDLVKISKWAYQWKMSFNPDITKHAQEVIFSWKSNKTDHPTVYFNHAPVAHTNCYKHLGM